MKKKWRRATNPKSFALGAQISNGGTLAIHLGPVIFWKESYTPWIRGVDHTVWQSPTGHTRIMLGERPRQMVFGAHLWRESSNTARRNRRGTLWVYLGFLTLTTTWALGSRADRSSDGLLNRPVQKIWAKIRGTTR